MAYLYISFVILFCFLCLFFLWEMSAELVSFTNIKMVL